MAYEDCLESPEPFLKADVVLEFDDNHPNWVKVLKDRTSARPEATFKIPHPLWKALRNASDKTRRENIGHIFVESPCLHPGGRRALLK